MTRPSTTADPAIAPIAAGAAPVRNACTEAFVAEPFEVPAASEHEHERGRERDHRRQQAAGDAGSAVAHRRHRVHHRAGRDLPERDGRTELACR